MNKKEIILIEAKRLFGHYGYLGFTLKQLAQACQMTSPALYYFYTSKASLFKDCLISELEARHTSLVKNVERSASVEEFASSFACHALDICDSSNFRTGKAMEDIIHLPEEMQCELLDAWNRLLIVPIESFIQRMSPVKDTPQSRRLLANLIINMATFSALNSRSYTREELTAFLLRSITKVLAE